MAPVPQILIRLVLLAALSGTGTALAQPARPLPIDPLWRSTTFRASFTGAYGIDSRIEPLFTEDEAVYLQRSAEAMAAGNREEAMKILRETSLLANSAILQFTLASHEFEAGNPTAAITGLEAALAKFPQFRDAHRNLGIVLVQTNELEKAKPHLVKALQLGSQDGITSGLLAYCHAVAGHHQSALDAYRLAMLTQPEERQWRLGAAQTLLALEQSREAGSILQTLITEQPAETATWLQQADVFVHLQKPGDAAANLEIVHRMGALDSQGLVALGHLYLQQGMSDLALARYETALKAQKAPELSKAVEALELYLANSDWSRARQVAEWIGQRAEYQPDPAAGRTLDPEVQSRLTRARALVELETGDRAAGAKLVEEWLRQKPTDGAALILMARFREEAGQKIEAAMLLEQAQRIPAEAAAAHLAHGRLLVGMGDFAKAVEQLEKAQALQPSEAVAAYLGSVRELAGLPAR